MPQDRGRRGIRTVLGIVLVGPATVAAAMLAGGGMASHPGLFSPAEAATARAVGDVTACGSFRVVDWAVSSAQEDYAVPGPGVPGSRPPADLIGLADALSNSVDRAVSSPLAASLRSYVYATATLGAAINHGDPPETTAELRQLAGMAGAAASALCTEAGVPPAWMPAPGRRGGRDSETATSPVRSLDRKALQ